VSTIRRARPTDAQALNDIAFAAKASWGYPASFMARCRAALAVDPKTMVERHFHLAEGDDGSILGFYGFEPEPDGIGLSHLFVAPKATGQGVGRALWRHAVDTAHSVGQAQLLVVSDPHAAGFYVRMGAQSAGSRPSEIDPARPLPMFRLRLDGAVSHLSNQTPRQSGSR